MPVATLLVCAQSLPLAQLLKLEPRGKAQLRQLSLAGCIVAKHASHVYSRQRAEGVMSEVNMMAVHTLEGSCEAAWLKARLFQYMTQRRSLESIAACVPALFLRNACGYRLSEERQMHLALWARVFGAAPIFTHVYIVRSPRMSTRHASSSRLAAHSAKHAYTCPLLLS